MLAFRVKVPNAFAGILYVDDDYRDSMKATLAKGLATAQFVELSKTMISRI